MANLRYVQQNRITRELEETTASRRRTILLVGLPVAAVSFLIAVPLALVISTMVMVAWCLGGAKDPARVVGAAGEDYGLSVLSQLPESYTIFNQVDVPDVRSRTGRREVDFIVCGPNGIFVIESKNHNGFLSGKEHDQQWTVHKVGRGGTPYTSSVRNPIRQVRGQVMVLKKHLNSRGLNPWITPIVTLSSNNDTSGIDSGNITVTGTASLADVIKGHRQPVAVKELERVVSTLAELTQEQAA